MTHTNRFLLSLCTNFIIGASLAYVKWFGLYIKPFIKTKREIYHPFKIEKRREGSHSLCFSSLLTLCALHQWVKVKICVALSITAAQVPVLSNTTHSTQPAMCVLPFQRNDKRCFHKCLSEFLDCKLGIGHTCSLSTQETGVKIIIKVNLAIEESGSFSVEGGRLLVPRCPAPK